MIRVSKSQKMLFGVFLVLASLISSVVAATVTINTDNRVEFGQGLYQVGACDSFVDITYRSNGTNITEIVVDGLDIRNCPETYVRIKLFGAGGVPLNLYQDSGVAVNRILLYINGDQGRLDGVDFLNARGLIPDPYDAFCSDPLLEICKSDGFLDLDYLKGRYRLIFVEPLAVPEAFTSFTVETSGDPFPLSPDCEIDPVITKVAQQSGSLMKGMIIDNLTIQNCEDKYIRIRFYDDPNPNALAIYQDGLTTVSRAVLYVNGESDFLTGLEFIHSNGQRVTSYQACAGGANPDCRTDGIWSLDYFNGRYTLTFETPTATFNNVDRYQVDVADELP